MTDKPAAAESNANCMKSCNHLLCTLYSGLVTMGGSHSPSISSSQSSGFLASGSGMFSGLSQSYNKNKLHMNDQHFTLTY